ncbi:similar to Saccharomyces cerevisiae YGR062C COX18 Mitochondrial integral inner membrane protein required for membrane insertion of C-terminus of Cox2p [Maudiozyma barnettii]|uniref:Similar to Saccharomyces cerevisiae YGR062C COX18 Mitochondrial integral inner membrane protein required for membrane insertion of C-terminus of Cox2p n=1 Tax=Maudiozyma barnettii TaxID=61262 RepID=A0A8H2VC91_9SACH|nr:membrane insertase COX18 [Kazachstania barnettii]CAB4252588.1 similar to Saccharomyces cerevisiae YGR062C COX18 Mitochondrial integral inner membrane protein required for membrane insertion of C-terminus of Cox2p [Kazachstania barnettii]CAD1779325.1 similar to Saccharomyces cerevisiae YGR062C COX18 Mitochondrial integral inner membrane protein required for membrane insertion of C-terminus of Cox2p [Kazachstania barnettii]
MFPLSSAARRPLGKQLIIRYDQLQFPKMNKTHRGFATFQAVADTFTAVHEASGIPWLVLIPTTTFALRTVFTLPFSIWQRKRIVKQQELRKVVQSMTPIIKLRLAAAKASEAQPVNKNVTITSKAIITKKSKIPDIIQQETNKQLTPEQIVLIAAKETRKRQKSIFKKHKVQMWKNMLLPVVQIPLWCTVSMGIRKLTEWKIEGSTHAWFESFKFHEIDLTGPLDVYPMIIPITLGIVSLLNVEYNGKMLLRRTTDVVGIDTYQDDNSRLTQGIKSVLNVSRIGSVFMMGVSSQASILLSLYWISSNLYSLLQNIVLDFLWPYQK